MIYKMLENYFNEMKDKIYLTNRWLETKKIKVYVRRSQRLINGSQFTCFDIANINVKESQRGKGIFTEFLNKAHEMNPWEVTYIENVNDERFRKFFEKQGFIRSDINYYKIK